MAVPSFVMERDLNASDLDIHLYFMYRKYVEHERGQ